MSLKDFEIGKNLGKGAFGSVCIVRRKEDGKTYAMKRVTMSKLSQKEKENALNEIRILASFPHQNIIGYNEAFFDEPSKTINIVMEFADDGDIQSKIQSNIKQKLSFKECTIWSILIQILQGMKYLHENNIIHRDLKSANLFLTKSGLVKIGDLNVSKITKLGMAYTQAGTPYYASPEIWKEKPYDSKTDIWSIGCIIYEMCALKPPFRGTSIVNLAENIKKGIYPSIPKMYSKELEKIISMMLQVNPGNRPSCDQLLKTEIIQNRMMDTQEISGQGDRKNEQNELIKTIKAPRNLKEINGMLPEKRYKQKKEKEMMENDEYETKKAGFFKDVNKEGPSHGLSNQGNRNKDEIIKQKDHYSHDSNNEYSKNQKKIQRVNEFIKKENNKNIIGVNNKIIQRNNIKGNNQPVKIRESPKNGNNNLNKVNNPVINNPRNNNAKPAQRPLSGKANNNQLIAKPKIPSNRPSSGVNRRIVNKPGEKVASNNPQKKKVVYGKINYKQLGKNDPNKNKPASAQPKRIVANRPNQIYRPKIGKK